MGNIVGSPCENAGADLPGRAESRTPSTSGWCAFAERKESGNFWPGRGSQKTKAVVLHIAETTFQGAVSWLTDPTSNASAHFVVGKDGRIAQLVSINDTAWANGLSYANGVWLTQFDKQQVPANPSWDGLIKDVNPNWYTVSIEHEGQRWEKWTSAMYDANLKLLKWIKESLLLTYILHESLIGHYEIDPIARCYCPGPCVEWERIVKDLA
jgi:N-acetylmuramoyl-L-alanine amidase